MNEMTCKHCGKPVKGRTDKKFCSPSCKNQYHLATRQTNRQMQKDTDAILHRNYDILYKLLGNEKQKCRISRQRLAMQDFNFLYCTGIYRTSQQKIYFCLYDFAWLEINPDEVLIVRRAHG